MTLQKQAEEQLHLKEEQLKAVFESSQDCILVWDKDCNYLYANKASIDHVKTTRDKVIGKNIRDALGHIPEFMNLWKSRVELVFETGKPLRLTDAMPVEDKFVYSESVLSPIRYPDGTMFGVGVVYRDMTEQKQAEMGLKASLDQFKRLCEASFDGIVIHEQGKIIELNQQYADMFGYTLNEIKKMSIEQICAPQMREIVRKSIASGYQGVYESVGVRKDGTTFPVEIRAKESYLDGRKVRIVACKDMTLQKQTENNLLLKEEQFKAVFDSSSDNIVVWDKDCRCLYANQAAFDHIRLTPHNVFGKHITEILSHVPEFMQLWKSRIEKVVETGQASHFSDAMWLGDRFVYSDCTLSPICYPDGSIFAISVVYRDMTEQKQAKEQLLLKQEELNAVFESSSDCISVWDKNCNCLFANQSAIDYASTLDKVVDKNICEILSHEPDFMRFWQSQIKLVFETGKVLHLTDTLPVGGKIVYGDAVLSPIRHPDGTLFAVCIVYRDVTEQKQAEMKLKASEERFKRLSETSFEGVVLHKNGEFIDANQKLVDLFGYTFEELRQINGLEVFTPQSRDLVKKNMALKDTGPYEVMGLKKDGTIFPVEIQAREIQIGEDTVRVGAIKDLTHHKDMQRQIAESEKRYRELYDYAQIPLYRTRVSDGKLLECNLALAIMLGYDSKEQCLREINPVVHYVNPIRRAELMERLKKEKSVAKFEVEFIRRNGAHGWCEVTGRIYPEKDCIEGVMYDITVDKVLSQTEKEILSLLMQGHGNKQVAMLTNRSVRTIEDHRSHIMRKLGVDNLVELTKITHWMPPAPEK
jgi:PAS domain S-box-containing protein